MREVHLRNVDLNLLHALYALLEERHVTRAAERCFLSQPAMSRRWSGYVRRSEISSSFAVGALTSARCGENTRCESWSRSCLGLRPWCEEKSSILLEATNVFEWP